MKKFLWHKPYSSVLQTECICCVNKTAVSGIFLRSFLLNGFLAILHWPLSSFSIVACPLSHSLRMLMPAALCMDCCMWVDGHGGESFDSCWVWHDPSAAQAIYRHQRQDSARGAGLSTIAAQGSHVLWEMFDARCWNTPLRMDGP